MSASDLLLIGVPVYMGRVPALIHEWLVSLRLHQTPTVCVVVYGNRVYEDALLELTDIVRGCGGIPIAGGAFIGEQPRVRSTRRPGAVERRGVAASGGEPVNDRDPHCRRAAGCRGYAGRRNLRERDSGEDQVRP